MADMLGRLAAPKNPNQSSARAIGRRDEFKMKQPHFSGFRDLTRAGRLLRRKTDPNGGVFQRS
jgi:hypothetical protein